VSSSMIDAVRSDHALPVDENLLHMSASMRDGQGSRLTSFLRPGIASQSDVPVAVEWILERT